MEAHQGRTKPDKTESQDENERKEEPKRLSSARTIEHPRKQE